MSPYQVLADAVLLLHFVVVVFIVGGLAFVVVGNVWHWRGANNIVFRLAHIGAIAFVVVQAWLGQYCPLTTLESRLRVKAGASPYGTSFIEHWVQQIMFYRAPFWVFAIVYTVFGLLVAWAWWRFPPRRTVPRTERDA